LVFLNKINLNAENNACTLNETIVDQEMTLKLQWLFQLQLSVWLFAEVVEVEEKLNLIQMQVIHQV
jgi:hypothetical protein